jgi:dienelactone hydrolase
MRQVVSATSRDEFAGFFPARGEMVFGILTRPVADPVSAAVVLVPTGAGTRDSISRNRIWVRLARRASALGFHAVRFDFHGSGESTGLEEPLRLDEAFLEDIQSAVDWVKAEGISRFVLVGSCFGARAALSQAARTTGLQGVVLATPYLHDISQGEGLATKVATEWTAGQYVRRALSPRVLRGVWDPRRRRTYAKVARTKARVMASRLRGGTHFADGVGPNFLGNLAEIIARRIPVLFLYGHEDDAYEEFQRARAGKLGQLLKHAGSLVQVAVIPGRAHAFSTVRAQEEAMEQIVDWLTEQRTSFRQRG